RWPRVAAHRDHRLGKVYHHRAVGLARLGGGDRRRRLSDRGQWPGDDPRHPGPHCPPAGGSGADGPPRGGWVGPRSAPEDRLLRRGAGWALARVRGTRHSALCGARERRHSVHSAASDRGHARAGPVLAMGAVREHRGPGASRPAGAAGAPGAVFPCRAGTRSFCRAWSARGFPAMKPIRYQRHPHPTLTALEGEGVVLHLKERRYFTVNETGLALLEALKQPRTLDELVTGLLEEYEVTADSARMTTESFLKQCTDAAVVLERAE